MGPTFQRYLLREVRGAFAAGMALAVAILFVLRMVEFVDLAFARGVPARLVLSLAGYIVPSYLEVALPMAALLSVVVVFARLSADGELIALRASGISLRQLSRPLFVFGVTTAVLSLALGVWMRPWANRGIERATYKMARTRLTAALRPGVFNSWFGGVILYVDQLDGKTGHMQRVVLSEERDQYGRKTIFAGEGTIRSNEDARTAYLQLVGGSLITYHASGKYHDKTDFDSLELNLDMAEDTGVDLAKQGGPPAMKLGDLLARRRDLLARGEPALEESVELHRKLVLPVAALLLPLVGVPLGASGRRGVKSRGLVTSVAVVLLYYLLLTAAMTLARGGQLPVGLAMWMPNVVLGLLGWWMFQRASLERPLLGLRR
ncbi:MAG TPA: LPS export ABC transporter permease LptF [Candidatus Limnocylindrales bacterium]|nr:LPS export ABC transporter permease LptF [Candidatus Limnocylindrales bacterium]